MPDASLSKKWLTLRQHDSNNKTKWSLLTAFGLAAGILQVISFPHDLLSKASRIRKKGSTVTPADCDIVADHPREQCTRLKTLNSNAAATATATATAGPLQIETLCFDGKRRKPRRGTPNSRIQQRSRTRRSWLLRLALQILLLYMMCATTLVTPRSLPVSRPVTKKACRRCKVKNGSPRVGIKASWQP